MSCDLKDFFLENPMSREEYMRIHSKYLPTDIRYQYQIDGVISAYGYFYKKNIKGMYGLKQTSIIVYNQIISHMEPHGYYPVLSEKKNMQKNTQEIKTVLHKIPHSKE